MARITIDIPDRLYEQLRDARPESVPTLDMRTVDVLVQAVRDATQVQQREEQMRKLREAFGDELDDPDEVCGTDEVMTDAERDALRRRLLALPPIDPPLSRAVREDRDDQRY